MSATVTLIPAGFSAIAALSAAMLNDALRRLPQMPSTEMPESLMLVLRGWDLPPPTPSAAAACRQASWREAALDGGDELPRHTASGARGRDAQSDGQRRAAVGKPDGIGADRRDAKGRGVPACRQRSRRRGAAPVHRLVRGSRLHRYGGPNRQHLRAPPGPQPGAAAGDGR